MPGAAGAQPRLITLDSVVRFHGLTLATGSDGDRRQAIPGDSPRPPLRRTQADSEAAARDDRAGPSHPMGRPGAIPGGLRQTRRAARLPLTGRRAAAFVGPRSRWSPIGPRGD